jgi:hypothetical protein
MTTQTQTPLPAPTIKGFYRVVDSMVTNEGTIGLLGEGEATIAFTAKAGDFQIGSQVYIEARLMIGESLSLAVFASKATNSAATPVAMTIDEMKAAIAANKSEKAEIAKASKAHKSAPAAETAEDVAQAIVEDIEDLAF